MVQKRNKLWTCPKCGNEFVTKNMWHSCGQFELEALFANSEPHVFQLYQKFVKLIQECGPVTIIPQKTRIAFQVRVRFAGCIPRKTYLLCSFYFTKPHHHARFDKIERYTPRAYGHYIRIRSLDEFDEQFKTWIREGYRIGEQKHLR